MASDKLYIKLCWCRITIGYGGDDDDQKKRMMMKMKIKRKRKGFLEEVQRRKCLLKLQSIFFLLLAPNTFKMGLFLN